MVGSAAYLETLEILERKEMPVSLEKIVGSEYNLDTAVISIYRALTDYAVDIDLKDSQYVEPHLDGGYCPSRYHFRVGRYLRVPLNRVGMKQRWHDKWGDKIALWDARREYHRIVGGIESGQYKIILPGAEGALKIEF